MCYYILVFLLSVTLRSVPLATYLPVQWLAAVIYSEGKKRKHEVDILPPTFTRFRMRGVSYTRPLCLHGDMLFLRNTFILVTEHVPKMCFYSPTYTFRI